MENVAEALKIAAAVLIFVLALSISINAFGEARIASKTILEYKDREYDYTYVEESNTTQRIVGIDSIVPSIYKAYKENYKIVFDSNISEIKAEGLYQKNDETGSPVPVYSIDLQKEVLGTNTQKEQFIMAILYGRKYSEFNEVYQRFLKNMEISLNSEGIYDKIKKRSKGLKENLGVYYQEEAPTENEDGSLETPDSNADVPDVNKTTKRVITYTEP